MASALALIRLAVSTWPRALANNWAAAGFSPANLERGIPVITESSLDPRYAKASQLRCGTGPRGSTTRAAP